MTDYYGFEFETLARQSGKPVHAKFSFGITFDGVMAVDLMRIKEDIDEAFERGLETTHDLLHRIIYKYMDQNASNYGWIKVTFLTSNNSNLSQDLYKMSYLVLAYLDSLPDYYFSYRRNSFNSIVGSDKSYRLDISAYLHHKRHDYSAKSKQSILEAMPASFNLEQIDELAKSFLNTDKGINSNLLMEKIVQKLNDSPFVEEYNIEFSCHFVNRNITQLIQSMSDDWEYANHEKLGV